MKLFITTLILFLSSVAFCQHYAYSYKGKLNLEKQQQIVSEIEQLHFFTDIKCFQKESGGELQFQLPTTPLHSENEAPYTITAIKEKLINYGCEPTNLIELGK
jgi:hypothetical protein